MQETQVTIKNETGLHARPASRFVKKAQEFEADITVDNSKESANAKSIMEIMSLGAAQGTTVTIRTEGKDEEEALKTLVNFIEKDLVEEE